MSKERELLKGGGLGQGGLPCRPVVALRRCMLRRVMDHVSVWEVGRVRERARGRRVERRRRSIVARL